MRRLLLLPGLLCALVALAAPAQAVLLTLDGASFTGLTSGTADEPAPGAQVTFTLGVQAEAGDADPVEVAAYQILIAWDDAELSLNSAQQLFLSPALPFTQDPTVTGSSAGATASYVGVAPVAASDLFSVTFDVLARIDDGFDDFTFAAVGDGLSPIEIAPSNPNGAAVAIVPEPTTTALTLCGFAALAAIRRRRAR